MLDKAEERIYDILGNLGISYIRYEYNRADTIKKVEKLEKNFSGVKCRNLFLTNNKGSCYYLLIFDETKKADLDVLSLKIGDERLSYASKDSLSKYLRLNPDAVSPFGIINDKKKKVTLLIDKELKNTQIVNFKANVNTAILGISSTDLEKFIKWHGNKYYYIDVN